MDNAQSQVDSMTQNNCVSFDKDKFKQVLHYIVHQCGCLEKFGKTVLFKMLYFSDFDFYELHEEKLTGENYRKLPNGPAPCNFDEVIEELGGEGKIAHSTRKVGVYDQNRYESMRHPEINLLSANELDVINNVIKRCQTMNATQISAYSHLDAPYKSTSDLDIIDYELVFYRDDMSSVREYPDD